MDKDAFLSYNQGAVRIRFVSEQKGSVGIKKTCSESLFFYSGKEKINSIGR